MTTESAIATDTTDDQGEIIYGRMSESFARPHQHYTAWDILDCDGEFIGTVYDIPTPDLIDTLARVWRWGFQLGRERGDAAARREIRSALGL